MLSLSHGFSLLTQTPSHVKALSKVLPHTLTNKSFLYPHECRRFTVINRIMNESGMPIICIRIRKPGRSRTENLRLYTSYIGTCLL